MISKDEIEGSNVFISDNAIYDGAHSLTLNGAYVIGNRVVFDNTLA